MFVSNFAERLRSVMLGSSKLNTRVTRRWFSVWTRNTATEIWFWQKCYRYRGYYS